MPDCAPDEGEQPSPQLPPHVIVATAAVAVATEVLPASQSVQEVADDDAEYLPAAQLAQMVELMPGPYLPASQSVQVVADNDWQMYPNWREQRASFIFLLLEYTVAQSSFPPALLGSPELQTSAVTEEASSHLHWPSTSESLAPTQ